MKWSTDMGGISATIGFLTIVLIYASVGVFTVLGSIHVSQKMFAPRHEQIFYGLFLVAIALFYLAFIAYFKADAAWPVEVWAVIIFALAGMIGTRIPAAIILGYPLHGFWDLLHEWHAHAGPVLIEPERLSPIPLGYGVFCLAFDIGIAVYFLKRRTSWVADQIQSR